MIRDWLIVAAVFALLGIFWLWLGEVFDAISEWHAAHRREESFSEGERGD